MRALVSHPSEPTRRRPNAGESSTRVARNRRRTGSRGAVFVESIIVISALTLGLTGVVFFRDSYQKRLGVLRLARAAAVAHSMAGCRANLPREWLGADLGDYATTEPQTENASAHAGGAQPAAGNADDGGRAARILDKSGTTSSDGSGLLNPIASNELSGQSRVSDRTRLGRDGIVFRAHPHSQSFVTCGDEVKDGDYDQVLDVVKDEAQALFNTH